MKSGALGFRLVGSGLVQVQIWFKFVSSMVHVWLNLVQGWRSLVQVLFKFGSGLVQVGSGLVQVWFRSGY